MIAGRFERIFVTVMTGLSGLMMGYALPLYLKSDWRWRLLAIPAAVLFGWFTWARYSGGHQTELPLENVSPLMRGFVMVAMTGVGFAAPFIWSLELQGSFLDWTSRLDLEWRA